MTPDTTLLIIGTSRGGTTLITAALGAHPKIAMLDEEFTGGVFRITGGKLRGNKLCAPNQLEWKKHYRHWMRIFGFSGFLRKRMFYNRYVPSSELSILDYLKQGPVQTVCILRDPNAVISSIMRRERRSEKVAIYRWSRCIEIVKQLFDEQNIHENLLPPVVLSFENLVNSPEKILRGICQQINIEFSPEMLEAPSKNIRYGGNTFDTSKTCVITEENHVSKIEKNILDAYAQLLKREIKADDIN